VKRKASVSRRPPVRRPKYPDLATYMAATGDTQANLARQFHVSQAQISRILAGAIPRLELRIALARYANIPIESFTWEAAKRRGLVA
jgi:transcriptional regulator with XRE-family HTH domain